MKDTIISWAHHSLNFWSGCNHVSAECDGCYAEVIVTKQGRQFQTLRQGSTSTLAECYRWNRQAKEAGRAFLVFTCSMSDFFHVQADPWRDAAWETIRQTQNLFWMILTKRPERIQKCLPGDWGTSGYKNVWMGTTCGCRDSYRRVDILREIPCGVRFISGEPLLESMADINLAGIHWLAAGGMSGSLHKAKAMQMEWAVELYDKCKAEGVAYLFKQVSAFRSETGVNALNLYLAERESKVIDPSTCALIRNHPGTAIDLMPFPEVGPKHRGRFTMDQWQRYKVGQLIADTELVSITVAP